MRRLLVRRLQSTEEQQGLDVSLVNVREWMANGQLVSHRPVTCRLRARPNTIFRASRSAPTTSYKLVTIQHIDIQHEKGEYMPGSSVHALGGPPARILDL